MNSHRVCQVCGKPITTKEMYFKKTYEGNTYFACCMICLSILQKLPEQHTTVSSGKETIEDLPENERHEAQSDDE